MKKHPYLYAQGILFLLFILLYAALRWIGGFAEWFCRYPAAVCRRALALLTGILPFSLYEIIVAGFVLFVLFLIGRAAQLLIRRCRGRRINAASWRIFLAVPVILSIVFNLFCLTLAPSYSRRSVAENMGLDTEISTDEAFSALEKLIDVVNESAPALSRTPSGGAICPYSFEELTEKMLALCDDFAASHSFYQSGGAAAKRLICSPLLTYTHISGVYGFFTGEANVNTNFPDLIRSATIAHEYSHARGIGPENECNFLAFVIGLSSEDAYIRYCAAANVFDELAAACSKADGARYKEAIARLDPVLAADFSDYNAFMEAYEAPAISGAADQINSAYLKSQGQSAGTASYSMIVELVVAYTNSI